LFSRQNTPSSTTQGSYRDVIEKVLLHDMLRMYPAQPATAVWRAVEIDALLRLGVPDGRGLDLGCGDGKLTGVILKRCGSRALVGIDPDPLETTAALQTGFYEAVHAAPGNSIPEPSQSFDFVVSNSVLEHIPDLAPVLAEASRLLRPGGRFLFTVPGPGFHANLRGPLWPAASRAVYLQELDSRLAHFRYPTTMEWTALCQAAGLRLDGAPGYLDRSETRLWETASRFTGGLLYALWGKRQKPIAIQRKLGLRRMQNAVQMPSPVASAIGAIIRGLMGAGQPGWLAESDASCLLVHGTKL
jgi:SAM-dependent methyltransferase